MTNSKDQWVMEMVGYELNVFRTGWRFCVDWRTNFSGHTDVKEKAQSTKGFTAHRSRLLPVIEQTYLRKDWSKCDLL